MLLPAFLTLLIGLSPVFCSLPCNEVTHSECGDDDAHLILETSVPAKEGCHLICLGLGEVCNFFIFDRSPLGRGNCRIYDDNFSQYILHCNELSGPKLSENDCDFVNPADNSCQIFRGGKCDFGVLEESPYMSSWENCQAFCQSTTECKLWRFLREEGKCFIHYSEERTCKWDFSPREPSSESCDDQSCDIPKPQQHGEWFCPEGPVTCHLECHPGYVSDNGTVIKCNDGEWSSSPSCVKAVALITGSFGSPQNTVEIYGQGLHKKLANLPDNRCSHSLQVVDSTILLCGGYWHTETSCLIFTASQEFTSHSTMTSPRYSHSSVSMLGQLHLMGGYVTSSQYTTEQLTPPSHQWTTGWTLLEDTASGCAAKISPELLIVTGGEYHDKSVIMFDVNTGASTRLQNLLISRYAHGCTFVMDPSTGFKGIVAAGGKYAGSTSEIYDITTGEWSSAGKLTGGRSNGVRMIVLGEDILAMGGNYGQLTVDRFNLTTKTWSLTEPMLDMRQYHAITGVPPNALGFN